MHCFIRGLLVDGARYDGKIEDGTIEDDINNSGAVPN
jgi:hypothetical protein